MDMTGLLTSPPQLNGKPQPKEFQTRKSMEKQWQEPNVFNLTQKEVCGPGRKPLIKRPILIMHDSPN